MENRSYPCFRKVLLGLGHFRVPHTVGEFLVVLSSHLIFYGGGNYLGVPEPQEGIHFPWFASEVTRDWVMVGVP